MMMMTLFELNKQFYPVKKAVTTYIVFLNPVTPMSDYIFMEFLRSCIRQR